jgi:hypothetical protein
MVGLEAAKALLISRLGVKFPRSRMSLMPSLRITSASNPTTEMVSSSTINPPAFPVITISSMSSPGTSPDSGSSGASTSSGSMPLSGAGSGSPAGAAEGVSAGASGSGCAKMADASRTAPTRTYWRTRHRTHAEARVRRARTLIRANCPPGRSRFESALPRSRIAGAESRLS